MNNPNIYGPLGSQVVTWDGDRPTVTQTLVPDAMEALQAQQRVQRDLALLGEQGIGTAQNILGTPFRPDLPGVDTGPIVGGPIAGGPDLAGYGTAAGAPVGDRASGRLDLSGVPGMPIGPGMTGQQAIMSRLAPQMEREEALLRNRLANQGLVAGGEAYQAEMGGLGQKQNDMLTQAALQGLNLDIAANQQGFGQALAGGQFGNQAVAQNFAQTQAAQQAFNQALAQNQQAALQQQQAANAAQTQGFNQALQAAQFGNTAQQQSLSQQLALRNQPLNEITGLMSGSQIQMPQFQGYQGSNIAPPPIFAAAQAQGQYGMDQYGMQQAAANANTSGLYGLAGAGLMAGATAY